ncbi:hypothetical protein BDV93DRAFT_517816, partial [Ceratobasidium sp. AG-I]
MQFWLFGPCVCASWILGVTSMQHLLNIYSTFTASVAAVSCSLILLVYTAWGGLVVVPL